MMYNICSGTIQWQIPDFLSDGNSNVYIFQLLNVKTVTWKFDLQNLGQGQ